MGYDARWVRERVAIAWMAGFGIWVAGTRLGIWTATICIAMFLAGALVGLVPDRRRNTR